MRARFSALVLVPAFLFFLQGSRAFLTVLFALASDALYPRLDPEALFAALAPLMALLAPVLPVARVLGRRGGTAAAVALIAVARVPLGLGPLAIEAVVAATIVAGGLILIVTATGYVERRALTAALIAAIVLDQLMRLAGGSWDLSLRPAWVPVQIVLSLLVLGLVGEWLRAPEDVPDGPTLERRAGGLRARGGIALGAILFLEATVLSSAAVLSRLAGVPYGAAGVLLVGAGAVALALTVLGMEPHRYRIGGLVLGLMVAGGAVSAWWWRGWVVAGVVAVGHAAALLLLNRALAPAGGRRPGAALLPGIALLISAHATFAASYFPGQTLQILEGGAPWVVLAIAVVLLAILAVVPRPEAASGLIPLPDALFAPGVAVGLAVLIAWLGLRAPDPRRSGSTSSLAAEETGVTLVTWNVHLGFDSDWRFDPEAVARTLERLGPTVAGLQEVPAGLPFAAGADLALWLGRRLGHQDYFAPTTGALLGDAFLAPAPMRRFASARLPGRDPRQVALLLLPPELGGIPVYMTRLGLDASERSRQLDALLSRVPAGPAVVLGDLNAEGADPELGGLAEAGFRDALAVAGVDPVPTFPADAPSRRIDWIWIRDLEVLAADVVETRASDHRPVRASVTAAPRDREDRSR